MLRIGLNPYGLTYTLGLQGQGTPRVNPQASGLDGFVEIADTFGARTLELDWRWLLPLDASRLDGLREHARVRGMTTIVSAWPSHTIGETLDEPIRVAKATGASLLRLHLTPVLEGARAARGEQWPAMVAHARRTLIAGAERARLAGLRIGIENHQDLGSEELLDLARAAGDHVGIVFDTGNPFAVGEDPVAFARRVSGRVAHIHIKDYRAVFTDDGYKLVRCAIGQGAVPLEDVVSIVAGGPREVTASIEPAALEARHIRLFTPEWWQGYPPREARELGTLLGRLRRHWVGPDEDYRTPWERGEAPHQIVAYEREQLERSVRFIEDIALGTGR